jgi:hypothetical protein
LLWQSIVQAKWLYVAIAVLMIFAVIAGQFERNPFEVTVLVIACLLGITVFIGDTTRERYRFLAERGVSRWSIWWTRTLIPFALVVMLCMLFSFMPMTGYRSIRFDQMTVLLALFSSGYLAGMWARRPVVGYMGAPLLCFVLMFGGGNVFQFYPEFKVTSLIAFFILLGCGYRMINRWSSGERGWAYHARFIGWLGLALLGIILPIAFQRWYTTPVAMPDWRAQTFADAKALPLLTENRLPINIFDTSFYYGTDTRYLNVLGELEFFDRIFQGLPAESDSDVQAMQILGTRMGVSPLARMLVDLRDRELFDLPAPFSFKSTYQDALLYISKIVERLSNENISIEYSEHLDAIELLLARELINPEIQKLFDDQQWNEIVDSLRSREQRRNDRERAILLWWANINSNRMRYPATDVQPPNRSDRLWVITDLAADSNRTPAVLDTNAYASYRIQTFAFERVREYRLLDAAVRISLEQLRSALPMEGSPKYWERVMAWGNRLTNNWIPAYERTIEEARQLRR